MASPEAEAIMREKEAAAHHATLKAIADDIRHVKERFGNDAVIKAIDGLVVRVMELDEKMELLLAAMTEPDDEPVPSPASEPIDVTAKDEKPQPLATPPAPAMSQPPAEKPQPARKV